MKADCHIHMVLDSVDWKAALLRHEAAPQEGFVRKTLARYRELGYGYLRDGGDRWGVSALAKKLAPEYGICYRSPLAPLCRTGHYGMFIGLGFEREKDFARLVALQKQNGADFIKIMASGLMDFHRFGLVTDEPMDRGLLRSLVHIAHEEGLAVMVHANGAAAMEAAGAAGADSVEHGAYADEEALTAMAQAGTVWVPTLSTVGNLVGSGGDDRFDSGVVKAILEHTGQMLRRFVELGGIVAPGTDAGAWAVPHGCPTEEAHLLAAGISAEQMAKGVERIRSVF